MLSRAPATPCWASAPSRLQEAIARAMYNVGPENDSSKWCYEIHQRMCIEPLCDFLGFSTGV